MKRLVLSLALALVAASSTVSAQQPQRPLSPPGTATAMIGGEWVKAANGRMVYEGGKWIEITYNRPMLRQRASIFGSGAEYGKTVLGEAPVWRLGANQSTRIRTEVPLVFDGKTLPAGEYSMYVDLKENAWTLIFSNWPAQKTYNPDDKTALWGGYGYTADKDALRVQMVVDARNSMSIDQLTIVFSDVTKDSGKIAIIWDKTAAMAAFTVGK
ncbi:MAG: DUF2911 domain-containing protein [Acidobacteriota bacterium]|nr:DUF2911 domain-containing protein [Acidobacteriota bacterium]